MDQGGGCWEWIASRNPQGYGYFWDSERKRMVLAHRAAYERFVGTVPVGLHVCHTCDNPSCVNPDHLFLGSQLDNMLDMRAKGRAPEYRGTANPNAKLSAADREEIRTAYTGQYGQQSSLARKYGVDPATVARVVGARR